MRSTGRTKCCDCGCRDDLDTQTDIDKNAEKPIPRVCGLLSAHDALVDTHVRGVAVGVVRDSEGGDSVDAREGAEDEQFVFWGDEVVSVRLGDCAADWLDGGLRVGLRVGLGVGLGVGGFGVVVVVGLVGGWDLLAEGVESGEAWFFGVQGCEEAPD